VIRLEDGGRKMTLDERRELVERYLGQVVRIEIDRPIGYVHKKEKYSLLYGINYGYVPGVLGGDDEELDVYLLGVDRPVSEFTGRIVAVSHRKNDVEDKLIMIPEDATLSREEIARGVEFQEKYYDTQLFLTGEELF
jgi:inorganic pyrophosphatase